MNTNKHFVRQRLLVLAVLLPMALLTRASVVLNATNFPDAVFRSYISEVTGVSEGGTLTDAILSKVYRIDVIEKGIGSLKGIEYFTKLNFLRAPKNNLTEIDLSNNTLLKSVFLNRNSLTSIDVSKNTELEQLEVGNPNGVGNNKISRLDLSNNPKIWHLRCEYNKLSSLVVSNMPDLISLYCDHNELAYLNVTNNGKLVALDCDHNQLTYLNLENNPELFKKNEYGTIRASLNYQTSTRRFQRLSNGNVSTCWALYVGTSDASRIKNLKIDGVSKTPVMMDTEGWMMVSDDLKHIPLKVTYDYDTGSPNDLTMENVVVNYDVKHYGVYVAGVELTSLNLNDIPGLKSGTAYVNDEIQWIGWAGTPTLVLNNAVIEGEDGINNQEGYWFKIIASGNNEVIASDFNALQCDNWTTTTLSGGGRLHVRATGGCWHGVYLGDGADLKITEGTTLWADGDGNGLFDDSGRLTISGNSTLAAYGRFYASVELPSEDKRKFDSNIAIRYPEGATIGAGYHVYYKNTTTDVQRDWVVIGPSSATLPTAHQKYGFQICGYAVDELNASDIVRDDPELMSGEVSFDADSRTLTLKNAHLKCRTDPTIRIKSSYVFSDLHVRLEGDNTLSNSTYADINSHTNTYIEGPGKLDIGTIALGDDYNLYIRDNCVIKGEGLHSMSSTSTGRLTISGERTRVELDVLSTVWNAIEGFANMSLLDGLVLKDPDGGYYDTSERMLVDANGNPVKKVLIESSSTVPTVISQFEAVDASRLNDNGQMTNDKDCEEMYNLQGQRVSNDYKGIVIMNGKKVRK